MSLGKHAVLVIAGLLAFAVCITLYIRFTRTPTNVAYVSEEDGGISVIDLNTLKVVKKVHPKNVAPRGIAITFDGNYLFTANKDTADATVFKTRGLSLLKRIPVGDNPEFVKIGPSGKWIYTSFEPGSSGGPPTEGSAKRKKRATRMNLRRKSSRSIRGLVAGKKFHRGQRNRGNRVFGRRRTIDCRQRGSKYAGRLRR